MALDFKYRIHEVAKDFGMASKDISQILTDYAAAPKNHMQVLEDAELDIIFEYLIPLCLFTTIYYLGS